MTSCCSGQILELTAERENLQQTHFDVDDVADITYLSFEITN